LALLRRTKMGYGPAPATCGTLVLTAPCEHPCDPTVPCDTCIGDTVYYKVALRAEGPDGLVGQMWVQVNEGGGPFLTCLEWQLFPMVAGFWLTGVNRFWISDQEDEGISCYGPYQTRHFRLLGEPPRVDGPAYVTLQVEEVEE
jgi:hypothetical protein